MREAGKFSLKVSKSVIASSLRSTLIAIANNVPTDALGKKSPFPFKDKYQHGTDSCVGDPVCECVCATVVSCWWRDCRLHVTVTLD